MKNWKTQLFNIPNMLSMFRLVLIPIYIEIYLQATEPAHYYVSGGILAVLLLLQRKFGPYRLGKRHAAWWAGLLALIAPLVIGSLAALDFDRAFVIFHQIFFPGKSNWLFDWRTDPIILALPQEFFRNCAILIGAGLVIFSLSLLIFTGIRDKKAGK